MWPFKKRNTIESGGRVETIPADARANNLLRLSGLVVLTETAQFSENLLIEAILDEATDNNSGMPLRFFSDTETKFHCDTSGKMFSEPLITQVTVLSTLIYKYGYI